MHDACMLCDSRRYRVLSDVHSRIESEREHMRTLRRGNCVSLLIPASVCVADNEHKGQPDRKKNVLEGGERAKQVRHKTIEDGEGGGS